MRTSKRQSAAKEGGRPRASRGAEERGCGLSQPPGAGLHEALRGPRPWQWPSPGRSSPSDFLTADLSGKRDPRNRCQLVTNAIRKLIDEE